MRRTCLLLAALPTLAGCLSSTDSDQPGAVGPAPDGSHVVPTAQLIRPAGDAIEIAGRPIDLALSPDGTTLYVKDNRGLLVVDAASWTLRQELPFGKPGTSMGGLAVSPDGSRVYATTSDELLAEATPGPDGTLAISRRITLPAAKPGQAPYPCGVALSADATRAFVCLSRNNTLGIVDLKRGEVVGQVPVGIAPFSVVLSPDGSRAYVANWGGRRPAVGDLTATSGGSDTVIEEWGGAGSGTVTIVDLTTRVPLTHIETGLAPTGLALSSDGSRLYVANTNSDTISVIDTAAARELEQISVRPDESLPFGSMPNALALSPDGATLYAANAGNNAVAVIRLGPGQSHVEGFVPTGWYPGAVVARDGRVYVANIKGVGSRSRPKAQAAGWHATWHRGSITRLDAPDQPTLVEYTARVRQDGRIPQILKSLDRGQSSVKPVPVPARAGEPSVFEHVVYVIKENRTYDQVLGDIGKGNSDPSLCIFGREVTPNHHALAEQFALLDNFYCNGVLSVDGHSWATEGNVTPYIERAFGGFVRSYTFGDDPLAYSSSKFIWDHILARGWSFRNYGEFNYSGVKPAAKYNQVFQDWKNKTGLYTFTHNIGVENVRRYSNPDYPGWDMEIPDQIRADVFLRELADFEKQGLMPNFLVVYLPTDHTSGTTPGDPTPRACVADNDLALGRIVEGLTHSRFWPSTCIVVMEDDPQDGFDHVDGHRSACLVISPYTKRDTVVSNFYCQASVVHTIERIFGATPTNQLYAMAPVMSGCFADRPDLTPYTCVPNRVPLAELNPPKASLTPQQLKWAELSESLALDKPDMIDEDTLNRILWHAARGVDSPYPAALAGAHGKGLAALGLRLAEPGVEDEDDDD